MIGQKFSEGKLPYFQVLFKQFPRALQEVIRCSRAGNRKYPHDTDWMNWSRVENGQIEFRNAALRHLLESETSTFNADMAEYDPKIRHMAQFCWNALCSLELDLMKEEKEDNPLLNIGENPTKIPYKDSKTSINWVEMDITKPKECKEALKNVGINTDNQSKVTMVEFKGSLTGNSTITPWYPYEQNPYHIKIPRLSVDELFQQNQKITPIPMQLPIEQEALKVVEDLNNESWIDDIAHYHWIPFSFEADGTFSYIKFMGVIVWDSDNDGRDYDVNKIGEEDEKIPLRDYIIKESKKITKHLKKRMKLI